MSKDLDQMSKIELLEYAKRCRYMLGKLNNEMRDLNNEILELKFQIVKLEAKIISPTKS